MECKAYPTDVNDDEWASVASYLALMTADAPQRDQNWREVFTGLRWIVRAGAAGRLRPHDFLPWDMVSPQSQRWLQAGVFDAIVHGRPLQLPPASGTRAGDDGATRRRGSTVPMAVDTLGHLLAAHVTAANAQDRDLGGTWAHQV
jgi:transposase